MTTPRCVSILVHVSMHQKLRKAHCELTRKWKLKINATVRNEEMNPVLTCLVWVGIHGINFCHFRLTDGLLHLTLPPTNFLPISTSQHMAGNSNRHHQNYQRGSLFPWTDSPTLNSIPIMNVNIDPQLKSPVWFVVWRQKFSVILPKWLTILKTIS